MRGGIQHASFARPQRSLIVRGSLARTFGGLAGFLVIVFLCLGFYILQDTFANPVEAAASAVLCAAFIISLAVMLLFFLINPGKRSRVMSRLREVESATAEVRTYFRAAIGVAREDSPRSDLAYQRFYVDHSRIRPDSRSSLQARGMAGK